MSLTTLLALCVIVALVAVNIARHLATKPAQSKQMPSTRGGVARFLRDFCAFRRMIAPVVIQAVFWLGVVACFVAAVLIFNQAPPGKQRDYLAVAFLVIAVGPFAIRLFCEYLILFFRINETLTEMKNQIATISSLVRKHTQTSSVNRNADE